ncbi:hypothetical protein ACQKFX_01165 [Cupriavidus metallidurans]
MLFERGVVVGYETTRRWCDKFGGNFPIESRQCGAGLAARGTSMNALERH